MSLLARNILVSLGITVLIIGTVFFAIRYLNNARVTDLNSIEDQISIDTLSLNTQFQLLETAPCGSIDENTTLGTELSDLGDRLSYTEGQLGSSNTQVIQLKQQYSLLEIQDYLITKQLAAACGEKPVTVLYFYSNAGDCADCDRAGYALSYLHDTYPNVKVYSFDYNLDLGALSTLISLEKVKDEPPAFIINNKTYYGFSDLATLESEFPKGALIATSTATTTAS